METILTRSDYEDFLVRLYFGDSCASAPLAACVTRAYLDFNRTLRGISNHPSRDSLYDEAKAWLCKTIDALRSRSGNMDQMEFDIWHQDTCLNLKKIYGRSGFLEFYIGQSQKWVNMTFKYIYTLGDNRVSGFTPFYQFCHVPIDNFVINRLIPYGFPKFPVGQPWSRIDQYPEYFGGQQWIRKNCSMIPLDLEFVAWLRPEFDLATKMPSGRDGT